MLKQRLVAFLPIRNGVVVQSIGYNRYLPVGKPRIAVEFLNQWGIDEIILVDIEATRLGRRVDVEMVRDVARYCFVPLTVGGGVRSVPDMRAIIQSGADKISINAGAFFAPELITQGAETFGSQCIIVSMDVRRNTSGAPEVFLNSGREATGVHPVDFAQKVERLGAGEILLNSIDRDGSKAGYDLDLAHEIARTVPIPIIICGGVGHPEHFAEGLRVPNVSAVAAGNFFHFSEHSATIAKAYLQSCRGQHLRMDTYADYREFAYDADGRLAKKDDEQLAGLFFEFHPKEVI